MKITDSSEIIIFDNTPISSAEQILFNVPHTMKYATRNIVKINDKYYYAKACSYTTLINELIGSYYSTLIGLDSVDYLIGKSTTSVSPLYALSEIFWKDEYTYTTVEQCYGMRPDDSKVYSRGLDRFYINETSILDIVSSPSLVDSALKMTAVDLKMDQTDRFNYNVVLRRDNDLLEMEKLYDYGSSYNEGSYNSYNCYINPFLLVKRNFISLCGLAHRYPQICESAAILSNAPLYDVLKDIEKRFNIHIEETDIPNHLDIDKKNSKILRMVK